MSNFMTPEERLQAKARCEEATPEPWKRLNYGIRFPNGWEGFRRIMPHGEGQSCGSQQRNHQSRNADAEFVAYARTDLPRALATIEALEAENKCLEANNALKDKLIECYQLASNPNCPHGRHLSKFCGDCDTAERDLIISLEAKVDRLEADRGAWKRYALALERWHGTVISTRKGANPDLHPESYLLVQEAKRELEEARKDVGL